MDQVSQIREKVDIVSFISEFIPLKKMGRNFKANCPFHGEKTPSFVVSPERQIWHCFGRSEEHTSELQSRRDLVCRLLLEKKQRDGEPTATGEGTHRAAPRRRRVRVR